MYTIISKSECSWCMKAKELLDANGLIYEDIPIPGKMTREEFYSQIVAKYKCDATVPQIFDPNLEYIGGYHDLVEHIKNTQLPTSDTGV